MLMLGHLTCSPSLPETSLHAYIYVPYFSFQASSQAAYCLILAYIFLADIGVLLDLVSPPPHPTG